MFAISLFCLFLLAAGVAAVGATPDDRPLAEPDAGGVEGSAGQICQTHGGSKPHGGNRCTGQEVGLTASSPRPRLLDLFCGAGGAAVGYHRAGFDVVGVDHRPQPNYPFEFIQEDALDYIRLWEVHRMYDAIHASPPCQSFSKITNRSRGRGGVTDHRDKHQDLVAPTRALLCATGLPYVIENVPGAPLLNPVQVCGSWFGLNVQRHRMFETNWPLLGAPCSHHWQTPRFRSLDSRQKTPACVVGVHGHLNYSGEGEIRARAMNIAWMSHEELNQAIPPAYTEFIGEQLLHHLRVNQRERPAAREASH